MKKITLLFAFLVTGFSHSQTSSGFVVNPSFEDGSAGAIAQYATLNDWKLGGNSSDDTGVSASIQTTNVHAGDGSNALEVTSVNTGGEWNIRLINTTYPFAGNSTDDIVVTVRFWAKTTDAAPGSANANGDMRLVVKDTGSGNLGEKTQRVLHTTTGAWAYITKTFTFPASTDYSLSLFLDFGLVDGVTQIDGITTAVSGGASIGDTEAPVINLVGDNPQELTRGDAYVELGATATDDTDDDTALTATIAIDATAVDTATAGSYSVTYDVSDAAGNAATQVTRTVTVEDGQTLSGFVANPSFEDGSAAAIAGGATLNDWKLGGGSRNTEGVSASIQTANVHAGDGSNALEVTSVNTGGEWNIRLINTTYPFAGDNSTPIEVTVRFWAKTTDAAPGSANANGDMRLVVKDTGSGNLGDKTNSVLLTTGAWAYITKTFTFAAAADYNLSLYLEFGKLDGVTQIDGITSSVSGGAVMGDQSPVINLVGDNPQQLIRGHAYVELGATATDDTDDDTALTATIAIDASAVDTATAGSYSVTYDVSDAAGNAATQVTRTVTVEDGQTYSGFVVNPSFEDGSAGPIAGGTTLNDWKLEGSRRLADGVSASIQTNNVHAGDGSNALEVTSNSNSGSGNVWDIALVNTTYPFAGDNLTPVEVTVSFWAKTDDVNPISANTNGDMRVKVRDAVGSINKANVVLLTTGSWIYITKTFTFAPAANYSLSLYFEFGKVDGVTQIDGITSSVTGGATLASGITWNGSTDNDWNTATNWTPERVPTAADAYTIIPVGLTNYPTFGSAVDINSVTMANGSSLISTSTFSGSITYTRNLATTNWYLVSSPVSGQDIDTFVSAEGLASGSGNNNMGLAAYDNSSSAWSYYQSGASGSGDFALGSGRSIKLSTAGDISFTGTMPVDDVSIAITNGYNLVGNPYPSYIAANTAADSSNNILSVNTSILSEETLWFWNQATNTYDAINQAPSSMYIAPVQGFFVETSGSNTLSITEAMQSHQSSDSFQRLSNERPEISLVLSDGENTRGTDVYYIDGTTTGFDNGYDSTTFGGAANSFSIYTHLVANSNGQDLAIQSLPNSDLDTMIIPVGITAGAGEEISISANAINLPEGVNIYLEDKSDDSFTLLDSTSVFTTTPDEDLNGIGRFYIHTTATALSDNQVSLTNVSMYLVDRNLTITGVHSGDTNVRVYDLLGKEVHNTSFQGTGFNKITLPSLTTGVYVVQLETQMEAVNKKIIIKK